MSEFRAHYPKQLFLIQPEKKPDTDPPLRKKRNEHILKGILNKLFIGNNDLNIFVAYFLILNVSYELN